MVRLSIESDCPICQEAASLRVLHRFEEDSYYVVGCNACTVQTILPHPTRTELKEFYFTYHNTRTPEQQIPFLIARHVALFESLRTRWQAPSNVRGIRYMEVGFGNGTSLLAAGQLGMEIFGFDLDPANVSDVTRRAESLGLPVHVQCGDVNEAIDQGEKFDFIKASQLIEHLIDPVQFIDSMSKLLSSGGYLYLECPNNSAFFLRIKNRLRRSFGRLNFYNSLKLTEHLWGFNRTSMSRLLHARGYDVVFCTDYPVRHPYFQPENLLWYPSLPSGMSQSLSQRTPYPLLKSLIPVFDWAVSLAVSGGIGLATLARRRAPRNVAARSPLDVCSQVDRGSGHARRDAFYPALRRHRIILNLGQEPKTAGARRQDIERHLG